MLATAVGAIAKIIRAGIQVVAIYGERAKAGESPESCLKADIVGTEIIVIAGIGMHTDTILAKIIGTYISISAAHILHGNMLYAGSGVSGAIRSGPRNVGGANWI